MTTTEQATSANTKSYDGLTIAQAARAIAKDSGKCHCGARYTTNRDRPWTVYATSVENRPHIVLEVHQTCAANLHRATTSCFLDLEAWRP